MFDDRIRMKYVMYDGLPLIAMLVVGKRCQISTENVHLWKRYKCMWQHQWLENHCIMHLNASIANQSNWMDMDTLATGNDGKLLTAPTVLYSYRFASYTHVDEHHAILQLYRFATCMHIAHTMHGVCNSYCFDSFALTLALRLSDWTIGFYKQPHIHIQ